MQRMLHRGVCLVVTIQLTLAACSVPQGPAPAGLTAPAGPDPWGAPATAVPGPLPDGAHLVWPHLIPVVTYDADSEQRLGDALHTDTRLAFPPVPGAIFGRSVWSLGVPTLGVTADSRVALVLNDQPARFARPMDEADLRVEPADVRVLRVGTFHRQPRDTDWEGGSFRAAGSGAFLLLVWVSAPCTMQGALGDADDLTRVDVTLHRAGWHWLAATPDGGDWRLTTWHGPATDVEFGALIERTTI